MLKAILEKTPKEVASIAPVCMCSIYWWKRILESYVMIGKMYLWEFCNDWEYLAVDSGGYSEISMAMTNSVGLNVMIASTSQWCGVIAALFKVTIDANIV